MKKLVIPSTALIGIDVPQSGGSDYAVVISIRMNGTWVQGIGYDDMADIKRKMDELFEALKRCQE